MVNARSSLRGLSFSLVFGTVCAGLTLVGVTGFIRSWGKIEVGSAIHISIMQAVYAFGEVDNFAFILSRMTSLWFGDLYFQPIIQVFFISKIPRLIWSDKPLILGNLFIMERYLPERFTSHLGEVINPSMPGQLILSGGLFFMVCFSALIGLIYAYFYRNTYSRTSESIYILGHAFLVLNIFNLLRSGTGPLGQLIVFLVISKIALFPKMVIEQRLLRKKREELL